MIMWWQEAFKGTHKARSARSRILDDCHSLKGAGQGSCSLLPRVVDSSPIFGSSHQPCGIELERIDHGSKYGEHMVIFVYK